MLRLLALLCIFTVPLTLAHAQWSKAQKDEVVQDCRPSCEQRRASYPNKSSECQAYCQCTADEMEKRGPDYVAVVKGYGEGNQEIIRQAKEVAEVCNKKLFR